MDVHIPLLSLKRYQRPKTAHVLGKLPTRSKKNGKSGKTLKVRGITPDHKTQLNPLTLTLDFNILLVKDEGCKQLYAVRFTHFHFPPEVK